MNTTTQAERDRITIVARFIVQLDDKLAVSNFDEAVGALIAKFGISKARAEGAVSRATAANRHKITEWIDANHIAFIATRGES